MHKLILTTILTAFFLFNYIGFPVESQAFLFHAARKAAVRRILKRGFSSARMKGKARFGKGIYAGKKRITVRKEVPNAEATMRLRESRFLKKNTIDLRRPNSKTIKKDFHVKDLRGKIKKGVIGPKLGHRIGKTAARNGKAVRYRSAKNPHGTNIFIPQKVYKQHPWIIRPDRVMKKK